MRKTPLIIQPSPFGWSMYVPEAEENLADGLVASSDTWQDLAEYAVNDLDSPVTISRDPILEA